MRNHGPLVQNGVRVDDDLVRQLHVLSVVNKHYHTIRSDRLLQQLCAYLPILELIRFSSTNRRIHDNVEKYKAKAFRTRDALLRYFRNNEEISDFRTIQRETAALIVGSFAVRFFERSDLKDLVLDLFVCYKQDERLRAFFHRIGYEEEVARLHWGVIRWTPGVGKCISKLCRNERPLQFPKNRDIRFPLPYIPGALKIYDLQRQDCMGGLQRIRVVVTQETPLQKLFCSYASKSFGHNLETDD
ncbi:hypothetical protein BDN72DRAFT_780867 [Pluteus cervinus]|uniref:Uncharacterized protein n=1 Tax=Pluteus cervinus TaxID=181527 RepID=A0ACD3A0L9_9AGAR|nr:hypothetical protein BDN72DRAFT_780867 [Pluteus cervinus]